MPRVASIQKQVRVIRKSLSSLQRAVRRLDPLVRQAESKPAALAVAKRRLKLSPKRRAALKLQGSYLGYMRQLKPAMKAKVKAVRASNGVHAAIRMAKRLAKG